MPDAASSRRLAAHGRVLLAGVVLTTVFAIALSVLGALHGLTGQGHDALVAVRAAGREAPASVVVIDVDSRTVAREGGLPLRRRAYGQAIDRLTNLGARAIAIDVQFSEPSGFYDDEDRNADDDLSLLEAIEATEVPVVLATSEVAADRDTDILGGKVNLAPAGATAAHSSVPVDPDGHVRRFDHTIAGIPTFAVAAATAAGAEVPAHDHTVLDPTVPGTRLTCVSFERLVSGGAVDPSLVRGRVAVIGVTVASATGDDDQRVAGSDDRVAGVELQAQAIDTLLRRAPLSDAGNGVAWILAVLSGFCLVLAGWRSLRALLITSAVSLAVLTAGGVLAVRSGLLVDPVPAALAILLGTAAAIAVRETAERLRRTAARATLARFVPPGVVDALLDDAVDARLPPQAQVASVLFCDLRGYTALVAGLDRPDALIAVLDAYLTAVTETVLAHGGTVVSFQGDGVMAAFGVPQPGAESAVQAVAAARALVEEALPRVRADLRDVVPNQAAGLALGVGVATGTVFAGTVGPPARREYAVVGPTTNLAARLQALTKTEGVAVLLDDATAEAVAGPERSRIHAGIDLAAGGGLRTLGPRTIRGLPRPIDVWTTAA